MKIVFFGTPEYVLPVVKRLHRAFVGKAGKSPIVAVVTQSPKPVGRKQKLEYSPIDKWAHERGIKTFYNAHELLESGIEADLGVLAAYGEIIPNHVLSLFPNGILNIHPSLLPKFRGASPVQATIASGETPSATIIKLDEKMDHGPIVTQFKDELLENDTLETLRNRLFERSAEVLIETIGPYIKGKIKPKPQDHDSATFTTLIKKDHGLIPPEYLNTALQGSTLKINWEIAFIKNYSLTPSAYSLDRFIRALSPWPGAWTYIRLNTTGQTKRIKILKAHIEDNVLVLDEVQLEGKNPVSWFQLKRAYPESILAS